MIDYSLLIIGYFVRSFIVEAIYRTENWKLKADATIIRHPGHSVAKIRDLFRNIVFR